jgi:hypothetical protein
MHIQTLALAEATRQLEINEGRQTAVHATGRQLVGRAHDVDHFLDEACLIGT